MQPYKSISQKLKSLPDCVDLESSPKKARKNLTNLFPILPSTWSVHHSSTKPQTDRR